MTTILPILLCLVSGPTTVQGKITDYIAKREAIVVFKQGHDAEARDAIRDAKFRIVKRVPGKTIYLIRWGSEPKHELETNLARLGKSNSIQLVTPDIETHIKR